MARAARKKTTKYFDYTMLFLIVFLLCFGLVMLYSSSSYISAKSYGDSAHYLKLQIRNILLGLIPLIIMIFYNYNRLRRLAPLVYFGCVILCILVYVPGLGTSSHGSSRWLALGPLSFQPSEVAKLGSIIIMAYILEKIPKQISNFWTLVKVGIIMLPLLFLVAISNLSTAVIIFGIAFCMMFVASPKYSHFFIIAGTGVLFIIVFIMTAGYRGDRVQAWLDPEGAGDLGFQTLQGLYAIGSGGLFGKGLGGSLQKMGNVPESQNDMIFTIICEELGLFGAICVILLFVLLIWRMMVIANNSPDMFSALIMVGIMSHVAIQVILNIAVVTASIPNTGVILPFISYGGTSLIFLMTEMGIALGISRKIKLETIE